MASVIDKAEIGARNKDGGIVARGHVFLVILDTIGMILALSNIDSSVEHGPKKGSGNLANTTANIEFGFTLADNVGFFITGGFGYFAEVFEERKFLTRGDQNTIDDGGAIFDVKVTNC